MKILEDKNILITGSNRGIGNAALNLFAKHGANIWAHSRTQNKDFIQSCSEIAKKNSVKIFPIFFDLGDKDGIMSGVKEIRNSQYQINGLLNNAGISHNSLYQMTSKEELLTTMDINFFGPYLLTQYISKLMYRNKNGSIVSVSSSTALDGNIGRSAYGASKAALLTATKTLSRELGQSNIRANTIAPGLTKTDLVANLSKEVINETIDSTCLKRFALPSEIASVAAFLLSDMSSYITGQVIRVDGGM
jgi:3-oxoacyl-[acyl-carrier protein] reductase